MNRLLVLLCITAIVFPSCSKSSDPDEDRPVRIGFSMDSLVVERWVRDINSFSAAAEELGAQVLIRTAGNDHQSQVAQIRELAKSGVDALVVVPNDAELISPVIREVHESGIPIISYDRLILNAPVDFYVSFNSRSIGEDIAATLVKERDARRIVVINGDAQDNNARLMRTGIFEEIERYGQTSIIGEIWSEDWNTAPAFSFVDTIIKNGVAFDTIIAGNDALAANAIRALVENSRGEGISVSGQDADLDACQRIVEGTQSLTVYKPIDELGKAAAAAAYSAAAGREPPAQYNYTQIDNGWSSIPFLVLEHVIVDSTNIEAIIIENGFHSRDDVYRNSQLQ